MYTRAVIATNGARLAWYRDADACEMVADRSVTALLSEWKAGDSDALKRLTPLVYDELRRLAAAQLRRERPDHTWSPTALVSEVFLRMAGKQPIEFNDRVHFFSLVARQMRHVLVDHARRRSAAKRGGHDAPGTFDEARIGHERPEPLVALDDALEALAVFDPRKARVVECFYFGGMSQKEIAALLAVHENTVARDLRLAQAWLHRRIAGAD